MSKGGAIQQAFDEVEVCTSRSQYMWSRVRDTFEEPISGGFVDFARCSLQDGAGMNELAAADAKMQSFLDSIGNTTRIYRWMPIQEPTCRVQISYKLSGKNHYPPEERIWMHSLTLEASNNRRQSMARWLTAWTALLRTTFRLVDLTKVI